MKRLIRNSLTCRLPLGQLRLDLRNPLAIPGHVHREHRLDHPVLPKRFVDLLQLLLGVLEPNRQVIQ